MCKGDGWRDTPLRGKRSGNENGSVRNADSESDAELGGKIRRFGGGGAKRWIGAGKTAMLSTSVLTLARYIGRKAMCVASDKAQG